MFIEEVTNNAEMMSYFNRESREYNEKNEL